MNSSWEHCDFDGEKTVACWELPTWKMAESHSCCQQGKGRWKTGNEKFFKSLEIITSETETINRLTQDFIFVLCSHSQLQFTCFIDLLILLTFTVSFIALSLRTLPPSLLDYTDHIFLGICLSHLLTGCAHYIQFDGYADHITICWIMLLRLHCT